MKKPVGLLSGPPAISISAKLFAVSQYTHHIYSSVEEIPRESWDAIWPYRLESYNYYQCVECSKLKEFQFFYFVLYSQNKIVLIAPFFVGDLDLAIALEGAAGRCLRGFRKIWPRFMLIKTLFCGSPFGEQGVIGIDAGLAHNNDLVLALEEGLGVFAKSRGVPMVIFKDLKGAELQMLKTLTSCGYLMADSFPNVFLDINFSSIDEYLSQLSYQTRKDLRRKIKKAKALGGVEVTEVAHVDGCLDEVYQLYLNTHYKGGTYFESLTKEYFINVSKYTSAEVKFFLYRANGRLIAFNLCFLQDQCLVDKYIGFDYEHSRPYSMFHISLLNNIQWCIDRGIKSLQIGQGCSDQKVKLGGKTERMYLLCKHRNRLTQTFLSLIVNILTPKC